MCSVYFSSGSGTWKNSEALDDRRQASPLKFAPSPLFPYLRLHGEQLKAPLGKQQSKLKEALSSG